MAEPLFKLKSACLQRYSDLCSLPWVVKNVGTEASLSRVQILVPLFTNLHKILLSFYVSKIEIVISTYLRVIRDELIHVKSLELCLTHSKFLGNVGFGFFILFQGIL